MAKAAKTAAKKQADFKRLAEKHGTTVVTAMGRISKLANKNKYEWTPKQLETLQKAFEEAGEACFATFAGKASSGAISL